MKFKVCLHLYRKDRLNKLSFGLHQLLSNGLSYSGQEALKGRWCKETPSQLASLIIIKKTAVIAQNQM